MVSGSTPPLLTAEKALIFRMTHVQNVPWILAHGLHCLSSGRLDPNFVPIGSEDIIAKRNAWPVRHLLGGYLSDYIPFYFAPRSPMMLNIRTGKGVKQRRNEEIVILVSSIPRALEEGCGVIFTDCHAVSAFASFYDDLRVLKSLPWPALNAYDFARKPDDPEAFDRYQAEALVRQHLPVAALDGIGSYTREVDSEMARMIASHGLATRAVHRPGWYCP